MRGGRGPTPAACCRRLARGPVARRTLLGHKRGARAHGLNDAVHSGGQRLVPVVVVDDLSHRRQQARLRLGQLVVVHKDKVEPGGRGCIRAGMIGLLCVHPQVRPAFFVCASLPRAPAAWRACRAHLPCACRLSRSISGAKLRVEGSTPRRCSTCMTSVRRRRSSRRVLMTGT